MQEELTKTINIITDDLEQLKQNQIEPYDILRMVKKTIGNVIGRIVYNECWGEKNGFADTIEAHDDITGFVGMFIPEHLARLNLDLKFSKINVYRVIILNF